MPIARLRTEREAIMSYDENEVWDNYYDNNKDGKTTFENVVDNEDVVVGYDYANALIIQSHYDKKGSYGWEVDHIIPKDLYESGKVKGDPDRLSNLRPLHWENNKAKGKLLDGNWKVAREAVKDKNDGKWYNHKPERTKWSKK